MDNQSWRFRLIRGLSTPASKVLFRRQVQRSSEELCSGEERERCREKESEGMSEF